MKRKIIFLVWFCLAAVYLRAQDCMTFFPTNEGAMLITRTYNGDHDLLNTMTYKVEKSYDYINGSDMQIAFMMTDNYNNVIDHGRIDASCVDGDFYLKMANRAMSPEVMEMLGSNTELVGNFLDYPDTFNSTYPFNGVFRMEAGQYTLQSKTDPDEKLYVRIYNRQYEKNERITTPAGTFDASKISFRFECIKNGETRTHRGIEWYAPGAGIVRTETYDMNNNLENYSELIVLQER